MARNKIYDIFLSHSGLDNDFTNKLHGLLGQASFNVCVNNYGQSKFEQDLSMFIQEHETTNNRII